MDIALGVIAGAMYFSKYFQIGIPLYWYVSLFLSVIIIYNLDHLLDALKNNRKPYRFHREKRKKIIILLIASVMANGIIIMNFFSMQLIKKCLLPGCLMIVYFIMIHALRLKLLKEITISLIYTYVIILYPFSSDVTLLVSERPIIPFSYFLLVLSNVFIFTFNEKKDKKESSILFRNISLIASFSSLAICAFAIMNLRDIPFAVVQIIMSIFLILIGIYHHKLGENEMYGKLADAVFLLSWVIFVWR